MIELLTIREVAKAMRLAPSTIQKWIVSGKLRALKLGESQQSRVRIPSDWLEQDVGYVSSPVKRRTSSNDAALAVERAQARIDSMRHSSRVRSVRRNKTESSG